MRGESRPWKRPTARGICGEHASCFEQAVANGFRNVVDIETDPDVDVYRTNPAFERTLHKLRESAEPAANKATASALTPE